MRKIAYLFPGQGAQTVGMGEELFKKSSAARMVFQEVDEALGRPLTKLLFSGPADILRETSNAQPAIMSVSLACIKAMDELFGKKHEFTPVLMAGHSLGEYTALAVAGVLDIGQTAKLVETRGKLMQDACEKTPGSMAAIIGLDLEILGEIAKETKTYVSNINAPNHNVISGERVAVANALELASARGARKTVPLRVGGAFHSQLMQPAIKGLEIAVSNLSFKDPKVPIVANFTGEPMTKAKEIKQELVSQLCGCVRWQQSIEYMIESGVTEFLELGPGKTLSSIVKRIDKSAKATSVENMESIARISYN